MNKTRLLLLACLLIADIIVLVGYRQVVRSSYLFVTAGTVFYPLITLNIIALMVVLALIVRAYGKLKK